MALQHDAGAERPAVPVTVALDRSRLSELSPLLQGGVDVPARTGATVLEFLLEELGISPEQVARVSTVFLDGDVVDDLEAAVLRDGARLALSAAMPGLVGATLRRGGAYAAMRAAITRAPERPGAAARRDGTVRVKLFNLLVAELGPTLLRHGILLDPDAARELLPRLGAPAPPAGAAAPVLLRAALAGAAPCP